MKYQNPIPTREAWQKLRDENKVPKGSGRVSIGDSIAKVHKSFSVANVKAMETHIKDAQQLAKDLDSYMSAIKPKYPAFVPIVQAKVKSKVDSHVTAMSAIFNTRKLYNSNYNEAKQTWNELRLLGSGKPKDVSAKVAPLKNYVISLAKVDPAFEPGFTKVMKIIEICDRHAILDPHQRESVDKAFATLMP